MKRALKLVVIYILLQSVFQGILVTAFVLPAIFKAGLTDPKSIAAKIQGDPSLIATPAALSILLSGIFLVGYLLYKKYADFSRKSFSEISFRVVVMSLPFSIGATLFCNQVTELLHLPDTNAQLFLTMSQSVWGILAIVIAAPIVEEMLFRGAIEKHLLEQGKSPVAAIVISALIFGIIHFNPIQSCFAFLMGLVFGWLYYRTKSIIPGIVAHFINNGISVTIMALDPENAQKTILEQHGITAFVVSLILSIFFLLIGIYFIRRELPVPPVYIAEDEIGTKTEI